MNNYRASGFSILPPVVKNLLIINVIMYLAAIAFKYQFGIDLSRILGLHYWKSSLFHPYQLVTYMFMHGNLAHIFFNMFAVWMFGNILERRWGSKKFLVYYLVTGIGAGIIQLLVTHIRIQMLGDVPESFIQQVVTKGPDILYKGLNWTDPVLAQLNLLYNVSTVGASGSLYGLLLAFGVLYPNVELIMMFFPIPIKAKYFVIIYGLIELISGVANVQGDNIAHFAHLGGMIFGFILLKLWGVNNQNHNHGSFG